MPQRVNSPPAPLDESPAKENGEGISALPDEVVSPNVPNHTAGGNPPKKKSKAGKRKLAKAKNAGRKTADVSAAIAPQAKDKDKAKGERRYIQRPYPQRTVEEALKVPEAIKDKSNGNPLFTSDVAAACGYMNTRSTAFIYLAYAARDYGLTTGTFSTDKIELTELGRKVIYPPDPQAERQSKIQSFFKVDIFKKVFDYYGGSKLPEEKYLSNTLENEFKLLPELHTEFLELFRANCAYLEIENGLREGETATVQVKAQEANEHAEIRVVGQPKGKFDRTAFVIMPFTERNVVEKRAGGFFMEVLNTLITQAANEAGFAVETAEQHGSDVIQQTIINRLLQADLVIADITDHNPNVMFELGIRMANEKPVQLIRAEGTPRIFDVDNMLRVCSYNPNLWATTIEKDRPRLASHIKATWDNRTVTRSYMSILTGRIQTPSTAVPVPGSVPA